MGGIRRFAVISGLFSSAFFQAALFAEVTILPTHYSMTDLGGLGGSGTEAVKINNDGVIVGDAHTLTQASHGFRSIGIINPGTDDLGVPVQTDPSSTVSPVAINNSGQIAAIALPAGSGQVGGQFPFHAYLIPSGGRMADAVDINTLGGAYSFANGMNDSGQIVGRSGLSSGNNLHAFLYTPDTGIQDLGAPNGTSSEANGVNNSGQIVGAVSGATTNWAFRTQPNSSIQLQDDLGTLGGTNVVAKAINNSGQVAGRSTVSGSSNTHLFRTKPNATINPATDDLGVLSGFTSPDVFGMNEEGDLVGWAFQQSDSKTRAIISFGNSNSMYNLNDLIDNRGSWIFNLAEGINDQGFIVARAHLNGAGFDHAFLLTPVPEPTVAVLIPVTLLLCRRNRRSSMVSMMRG